MNNKNMYPHGGPTTLNSTEENVVVETILNDSDWDMPFQYGGS